MMTPTRLLAWSARLVATAARFRGMALSVVVALGACSADPHVASGDAPEEKVLYVYNWADYIGKNTLAEFERASGIKVVYDTYDADERLCRATDIE
jgi:spermidine/putrescine-binding protein